jgi:RNA polymerase sigma-70 factor (ECF subfamily)
MTRTFDARSLEERFRDGDEAALIEAYRQFSGPMFATAFSLLGNRDLAADALQQAFVQAWRASATFDTTRGLQPWLYAITRRTAVDVYRRQRRTSSHIPYDDAWPVNGDLQLEGPSLDTAWKVWQVRQALDQIHPDEREVLELAYYGGLTQTEIAARLAIAVGTVKSRTSRAQKRLAALLTHLRDDTEAHAEASELRRHARTG